MTRNKQNKVNNTQYNSLKDVRPIDLYKGVSKKIEDGRLANFQINMNLIHQYLDVRKGLEIHGTTDDYYNETCEAQFLLADFIAAGIAAEQQEFVMWMYNKTKESMIILNQLTCP